MKSTWDIFISYASPDKETADEFAQQLEANGATCWIAPRNIDLGGDYGEGIVQGIKNSMIFVLVFSAQANGSKYVLREVDRAIELNKMIIPINIDSTLPTGGMEFRLCTIQWLEADGVSTTEKVIRDILTVLDSAQQRVSQCKVLSKTQLYDEFGRGTVSSLHDDFEGNIVSSINWHIPTWVSPTDGTFVGQTQFRCAQASSLPTVIASKAIITVESYNPSAPSFYGTDLISNLSFPEGQGIHITVRAKMDTPTPGIVGGISYMLSIQEAR